ncbi:MAG: sigma-70 family RNA polymerase sigma factor [Thermoanaerobaculia bacterium]
MAPTARRLALQEGLSSPLSGATSAEDLDTFYRSVFLPLVRRATWKHGLSKEDARDIVQDAFLLAIAKIDLADKPKAWLIQVVDHLAINHWRKNARRALLVAKWAPAGREFESPLDEGDVFEEVEH